MSDYRSPWWPRDVALPGDPKFRESATRWLFAILPDGYSDHEVIRRYPSVAVALARQMLIARYEGTRHAYRTVRSELDEQVPPQYIEDLLEILRDEGVRLLRAAQGPGRGRPGDARRGHRAEVTAGRSVVPGGVLDVGIIPAGGTAAGYRAAVLTGRRGAARRRPVSLWSPGPIPGGWEAGRNLRSGWWGARGSNPEPTD